MLKSKCPYLLSADSLSVALLHNGTNAHQGQESSVYSHKEPLKGI